jgi:hypothetical protein
LRLRAMATCRNRINVARVVLACLHQQRARGVRD